jgi:hypothetical protein
MQYSQKKLHPRTAFYMGPLYGVICILVSLDQYISLRRCNVMIVFTDIKFHVNSALTIHGASFEIAAIADNFMRLLVSLHRLKADPK